MNILSLEHLTHSYTERKLFDDADFYLHEGDKVGVIGINGTGKSTLLKIMAGLETPDEGQVIQASNLMIHYLPQNPEFEAGRTVLDCVIRENMAHEHAWDLEGDAKSMLNKLGITDYSAKVETLSGGQRKRVALAAVLLSTADLLILDEPTNHLDSAMADWLEEYLKKFRGALLMITHDRYFLDRIVNRIFSFEGDGKVRQFEGGYSDYLIRKELEGLDTEMSLKGHAAGTEEQPKKAESSSKDTWKQREPKLKFTFKEQREFESIDDDIAKLEEKIETLDAQIAANATNSVKLRELMEKKEETENALDEKMDRWVYLNDLNEKIQDAKQQG